MKHYLSSIFKEYVYNSKQNLAFAAADKALI